MIILKIEILKTGKNTKKKKKKKKKFAQIYSKKQSWILSQSKYKGTKQQQKVLGKN